MAARLRATDIQKSNIDNWMNRNNDHAISPEELEFFKRKTDIIPVVQAMKSPLRKLAERKFGSTWARLTPFTIEVDKPEHYEYGEEGKSAVTYFNDSVIDRAIENITLILGLAMMLLPLWILQLVAASYSHIWLRLLVISIFMVAFTIILSAVTASRSVEILAATAAYGAVLMVYMQLDEVSK